MGKVGNVKDVAKAPLNPNQMLALARRGYSRRDIAAALGCSAETVSQYLRRFGDERPVLDRTKREVKPIPRSVLKSTANLTQKDSQTGTAA